MQFWEIYQIPFLEFCRCNFLNFAKNVKCLRCNGISQEKVRKFKEEFEHLPLKKGDWICDKCDFLPLPHELTFRIQGDALPWGQLLSVLSGATS